MVILVIRRILSMPELSGPLWPVRISSTGQMVIHLQNNLMLTKNPYETNTQYECTMYSIP